MLGIVVPLLIAMVVASGAVLVAMLFDVALGDGAQAVVRREEAERRWKPPYVSGRDLFQWARSIATTAVDEVLWEGAGASTARDLVQRLDRGAARAMLPELGPKQTDLPVACPPEGQGVIGVTAPEAIAIAEALREAPDEEALADVRLKAATYRPWVAGGMAPTPCALQGDDCLCVAYPVRPMACRSTLAARAAARVGRGARDPGAGPDFAADHAVAVGFGVVDGLAAGLRRAGLDSARYELHSALERALSVPDAGARWAAGEPVFEGCAPYQGARGSSTAG